MAPLINLLPNHRAESRKARARRFWVFVAVAVGAAAAVIGVTHLVIGARVSVQEGRNNYLQTEITSLDKQIAQIKDLKSLTQGMLARKRAVESLQASRSQAVALLNQISKVPEGVYYTSVRQSGDDISLTGYAQSNFHVANLIHTIENSGVFMQPKLLEARQTPDPQDPNNRVVQFQINCKMANVANLNLGHALVGAPGMPNGIASGAMVMGPNGQLVPAQAILSHGARVNAYMGMNGAAVNASPPGSAGAAPIVPPLPSALAPTPQANALPPIPGAAGAQPSAAHPATPRGGILGAQAHTALDAAHLGANTAARPPNDMNAAADQAK